MVQRRPIPPPPPSPPCCLRGLFNPPSSPCGVVVGFGGMLLSSTQKEKGEYFPAPSAPLPRPRPVVWVVGWVVQPLLVPSCVEWVVGFRLKCLSSFPPVVW